MSSPKIISSQIERYRRQLDMMSVENDITHSDVFGAKWDRMPVDLSVAAKGNEELAPGYIAIAYPNNKQPFAVPFIDVPTNGGISRRPRHNTVFESVMDFSRSNDVPLLRGKYGPLLIGTYSWKDNQNKVAVYSKPWEDCMWLQDHSIKRALFDLAVEIPEAEFCVRLTLSHWLVVRDYEIQRIRS